MVVQLILASRMGTRELESDEEDENAFEVPREQLSKFTGKAPPTKSQLQEAIEKAATEAGKKNNESNAIVDGKEVDKEQAESLKLETPSKVEDAKIDLEKKDEKLENSEAKKEGSENNDIKEKVRLLIVSLIFALL